MRIEEQQAIIEFRLRASRFTEEGLLELAAIPDQLTETQHPKLACMQLLQNGNFLLEQYQ